jgi:hypothetical protein
MPGCNQLSNLFGLLTSIRLKIVFRPMCSKIPGTERVTQTIRDMLSIIYRNLSNPISFDNPLKQKSPDENAGLLIFLEGD